MNPLGSNFEKLSIAIGLAAPLFYWAVVASASANEETGLCGQAAPLEMLSSGHIFEKICSISVDSKAVDFFVIRASMRHNPLLSSKLTDYFSNFPSISYNFSKVGTGNLYRLSLVNADRTVNSSPLGVSSYLLSTDEGDTWVRCNDGFDRKCSVYEDVAQFNEASEWAFCKIEIVAKFSGPPSDDVIVASRNHLRSISRDLRDKRGDDMMAACSRGEK